MVIHNYDYYYNPELFERSSYQYVIIMTTQKQEASPPTPLRMERGVITVIPLVVHKCFCSSLLDYLSKLYYSSKLYPALPLSAGEGVGGVRLFFTPKKKGRRKIIFYIFPFGLYSFLSPQLSTPRYVHIHKDIVVSASSLHGKESGRVCWVTLFITVLHRLDECCAYYSC